MRSWGWGPHNGISSLLRRDTRELSLPLCLSLPWEDTWRRPSTSQRRTPSPGSRINQHFALGFPSLQNCEKYWNKHLLFKLTRLLYQYFCYSSQNWLIQGSCLHPGVMSQNSALGSGSKNIKEIRWEETLLKTLRLGSEITRKGLKGRPTALWTWGQTVMSTELLSAMEGRRETIWNIQDFLQLFPLSLRLKMGYF